MKHRPIKYDKDYKKVMKCLQEEFKWVNIQVLPHAILDLINDTVKATKKITLKKMDFEIQSLLKYKVNNMNKKLKFWNGRGHGKTYGRGGSFYVAAYSVKEAVEIINSFENIHVSANEINHYYSKCWGNPMDGINPTEPCLYAQKRYETPILISKIK